MFEEEKISQKINAFDEKRMKFKEENQKFLDEHKGESSTSKLKKFESKSNILNGRMKLSSECQLMEIEKLSKKGFTNAMMKTGFLYILKIPESLMESHIREESHSSIILTHQLIISAKKQFCVLKKGKIYRFDTENAENATKMLDLRNSTMDLTTIQRPDQIITQSSSCNLEQAIQVNSLNKTFLFMSAARGDHISKRKDIQDWFDYFKKCGILLNMKSYYEIGNLLGKGNFAKVYEAVNYKTKETYALKTIEKKILSKNQRNFFALLQEVNLLRKLNHENIIHLHEVYESENNIHLILEYLHGGELFERIKKNGSYNEKDTSIIMRCILEALVAMHNKQVVHRDLKPENLLFKSDDISSLKIVDFGLSTLIKEEPLSMRCGSPGYVAPEILNDLGYGTKADIFSAGIILYILLTGKFVFSGKNYREILLKNKECQVPYPPQYWSNLTPEAKDLVKKMLEKDPTQRFSAAQALQHPWFKLNVKNLQQLELNFEEVDDLQLNDDEPSLINSVNLQLVTTSPIWNKAKMRDEIKKVNAEQDKRNTFQTPLPNPKFLSCKGHQEGQQKQLKGVVVQNLYHQPNNNNYIDPDSLRLDEFKKQTQYQTPEYKSTSLQAEGPKQAQNSTLNLLRSIFKKEESNHQQEEIKEEIINKLQLQQLLNNEKMKNNDKNSFDEDRIQDEGKIQSYNQYLGTQITQQNNNNISKNQKQVQQISCIKEFSRGSQSPKLIDIENQSMIESCLSQNIQGNQQQLNGDPIYERMKKKWADPQVLTLSKVLEDEGQEDSKSNIASLHLQSSEHQTKSNPDKLKSSRHQSVDLVRGNIMLYDKSFNQQNQQMQQNDLMMKSIDENNRNKELQQQVFQLTNKPIQLQISQNQYSDNQILQNPNENFEKDQLPKNYGISVSTLASAQAKSTFNKKTFEDVVIKNQQQFIDIEDEILEDNEMEIIDEFVNGGSRMISQNKIVDFNAHSSNCLRKDRSQPLQRNQIDLIEDNHEDNISLMHKIEFGNLQNLHPQNISSVSVSFQTISKNQSNIQIQGSSSQTPNQELSNSNFSSTNQIALGFGTFFPNSHTGENSQLSSSSQLQSHAPPISHQKQIKHQKKSQFWGQNQSQLDHQQNDQIISNFQQRLSDSAGIEEANVEGHIDTEEQLVNNNFQVPTTPGSVYGGSRGVMKQMVPNSTLTMYSMKVQPQKAEIQSPINLCSYQSNSIVENRGNELQQNVTFNNSGYFKLDQSKNSTPAILLNNRSEVFGVAYSLQNSKEENQHSYFYQHEQNVLSESSSRQSPFLINHDDQMISSNPKRLQTQLNKKECSPNKEDSNNNSLQFYMTPDQETPKADSSNKRQSTENKSVNMKFEDQMAIRQILEKQKKSQLIENEKLIVRGVKSNTSSSGFAGGDDKSFYTAYQSLADLQDFQNSGNNTQTINNLKNEKENSFQNENIKFLSSNSVLPNLQLRLSKDKNIFQLDQCFNQGSGCEITPKGCNDYSCLDIEQKLNAQYPQSSLKFQYSMNCIEGVVYSKNGNGLGEFDKSGKVANARKILINNI